MNLIVSVSEFRENISKYLDKVTSGASVVIKDEKRNVEIAQARVFLIKNLK